MKAVPAISERIPKSQTVWCNKIWSDWAKIRNTKLLAGENPSVIVLLSLILMNFWISGYVMEVQKANGDAHPPSTLIQL